MRRQQPAGSPPHREVKQPIVDARTLGARPDGAQRFQTNRIVGAGTSAGRQMNQLPVDARSLGSRPAGAQSPLLIRKVLRGAPDTQQGSSREGSARYTGAQGARMAGQASRDRKPRQGKRGGERDFRGVSRYGTNQEVWTEEEQQYFKEQAELKAPKPLDYEPVDYNRDTFAGVVPAIASDEWSMSEMLGERLLLARKYLDGEFIQWDSKEQKADVMAVVEKLSAVERGGRLKGDVKTADTASTMAEDGNQPVQSLMQKLCAGEYTKFKSLEGKDVLGHVERHVHRNDSFYPDDEKSLLRKVRSILPAQQASKIRRGTKDEVKA